MEIKTQSLLNTISLFLTLLIRTTLSDKIFLKDFPISSNSAYNLKRFVYTNSSLENITEKANLSFAFNFEFNSSTHENKTFHIYLIKSDVIPHFDLLNNPAICCSDEGGSICDEFYSENDSKLKNDNLKVSNLLKDHAEFYKDYALSPLNKNFILKKFIEKKGEKLVYNNPYLNALKQHNNNGFISNNSSNLTDGSSKTNIKDNRTETNVTEAEENEIDYAAVTADNTLIVNESSIINTEGVYFTFLLVCSGKYEKANVKANQTSNESATDNSTSTSVLRNETGKLTYEEYSEMFFITGNFSFLNSHGYLSADDFHTVDLYLFLSLFYFLVSTYWFYKIILYHNSMNVYSKLITLMIPLVLLEKLMDLQLYSEMNREGVFNYAFHVIFLICNVFKNIFFMVLIFLLSIGYNLIMKNFSNKKIFNMTLLFIGYIIALVIHSVSNFNDTYYDISEAQLILSSFFMYSLLFYIAWKIFKGFRKQLLYSKFHNIINFYALYEKIYKLFLVFLVLCSLYAFLSLIYYIFVNKHLFWSSKWFLDLIGESIPLSIFVGFILYLNPSKMVVNKDGYTKHVEDTDIKSTSINKDIELN